MENDKPIFLVSSLWNTGIQMLIMSIQSDENEIIEIPTNEMIKREYE